MGSSKHTKTFFLAKRFLNFLTLMKKKFSIISKILQKIVDSVKICAFYCYTFLIECNKGLFLDVNIKKSTKVRIFFVFFK